MSRAIDQARGQARETRMDMREFYLGLDLGGTAVKAGVVDRAGKLLSAAALPTQADRADVGLVIASMVRAGREAMDKAGAGMEQVAAVGVAAAGILALGRGVVVRSANLPGWANVPLRKLVGEALGKPAILENDANAAAFGEYWAGAGQRTPAAGTAAVRDMVMITLGTGVGGGIIDEGRIVHGAWDFAGEIGHTIIVPDGNVCPCGQRGCLETYCSASATARRAAAELQRSDQPSALRDIWARTGQVTCADVAAQAQAGDALAAAVWDESCRYIALGCLNLVRLLDPQVIVLAGGMAAAGPLLRDAVTRHLHAQFWTLSPPTVQIALATLGNNAGVIGAAGLAVEALRAGTITAAGT